MDPQVVQDLCRLIVEFRAILEALRAIFDELDLCIDDPNEDGPEYDTQLSFDDIPME